MNKKKRILVSGLILLAICSAIAGIVWLMCVSEVFMIIYIGVCALLMGLAAWCGIYEMLKGEGHDGIN